MKINKISATKARNNFFGIVQDAYLNGNTFLIDKNGIPMAYIMPVKQINLLKDIAREKKITFAKLKNNLKPTAKYILNKNSGKKMKINKNDYDLAYTDEYSKTKI